MKLALLVSSPIPRAPAKPLHPVEGRFLFKNRFNLAQVGLGFVVGDDRTYECIGEPTIQCKQQTECLFKRVATPNVCIGEWEKLKTDLIFRGAGQITEAERRCYDPAVSSQGVDGSAHSASLG